MSTSEQKKPQAGEWWIHDDSSEKAYFIGRCPAGIMVWQIDGDDIEHGNLDWSGWHHEPRCTGWDWQPQAEPEWFDLTPFDSHQMRVQTDYAYYLPHDQSGEWRHASAVFSVSTVGELKKLGYTKFRCLLKDAPKPAEDPDEWVTQDRCHVRKLVDQFRWITAIQGRSEEWLTSYVDEPERHHGWFHQDSGKRLELRCRRRDLPPMPEKPKTETVTFHEVMVWRDGTRKLELIECPSEACVGTGRTETRTIKGSL